MLSVGTIRFEDKFCTSKKGGMGEVGGCHHPGDSTWRLSWLAAERSQLPLAGPFLSFNCSIEGVETAFQVLDFWHCREF